MSKHGYIPQDKPLYEGVDKSNLPEVLQVDGRTVDGIKTQIREVIDQQIKILKRKQSADKKFEEKKVPEKPMRESIAGMKIKVVQSEDIDEPDAIISLNLNEAQKEFILAYVRYGIENGIQKISGTLSGAAYDLLSRKPEEVRNKLDFQKVFEKLAGQAEIVRIAKILARAPHDVDAIVDVAPLKKFDPTEEQKENFMLKSQQALQLLNYDDAVWHAQMAVKDEVPDNFIHIMLCLLVRAAKKESTLEEKMEDLVACLEYSLQFRKLAKTNIAFQEQMGKMTNLMKRAADGRSQLIKAIEEKRKSGNEKKK